MLISICTTTARSGFVEQQAKMLAEQQTAHDVEWVLVDFDYDNRKGLVQDIIKKLSFPITHVPNCRDERKFFRDISRNRNKALQYAKGAYAIFLDDFAVVPYDFVERHMDVMRENALSCGLMHRLEANTDLDILNGPPKDYEEAFAWFSDKMGRDYRNRNGQNYRAQAGISYTGNLGIPRIIFEQLNGFDPRMEGALEDCDFGLRADKMGFATYFNAKAYTINLNVAGFPYVFSFEHAHDCEPFISNPNNNYRGDAKLAENEFMTVEFCDHYRVAHCKKCGASGMIDPNELIIHKLQTGELQIPPNLPGGLDTLRKAL